MKELFKYDQTKVWTNYVKENNMKNTAAFEGICAVLVCRWLRYRIEGGLSTDEIKQLALQQGLSAYLPIYDKEWVDKQITEDEKEMERILSEMFRLDNELDDMKSLQSLVTLASTYQQLPMEDDFNELKANIDAQIREQRSLNDKFQLIRRGKLDLTPFANEAVELNPLNRIHIRIAGLTLVTNCTQILQQKPTVEEITNFLSTNIGVMNGKGCRGFYISIKGQNWGHALGLMTQEPNRKLDLQSKDETKFAFFDPNYGSYSVSFVGLKFETEFSNFIISKYPDIKQIILNGVDLPHK